jgi:hypothetical protein
LNCSQTGGHYEAGMLYANSSYYFGQIAEIGTCTSFLP